MLENIVYFELLRRGYDVSVGKIGSLEVDFVATKSDKKNLLSGFGNDYERGNEIAGTSAITNHS